MELVEQQGARFTLLFGYAFVLAGFLFMLLVWGESSPYWHVGLAYSLVGAGVGFAGTPASHSLTGAVPVTRAGMASGTADLQRDLGGAIMQSILGALQLGRPATFQTRPCALDREEAQTAVTVTRAAMDLAVQLGAGAVIVSLGSVGERGDGGERP